MTSGFAPKWAFPVIVLLCIAAGPAAANCLTLLQ